MSLTPSDNAAPFSFPAIDENRQRLETQIAALRKSLKTWQTWSAEYEGLKEEVFALSPATPAQLCALADTYAGDLVTKSEIRDILGLPKGSMTSKPVLKSSLRNAASVLNVLDRRIEYVTGMITDTEKQLSAAEQELEAAMGVDVSDLKTEEGDKLMEIWEEVDAEGNMIGDGRVDTFGGTKGAVEEVLRRAGIGSKDLGGNRHSEVAAKETHGQNLIAENHLAQTTTKLKESATTAMAPLISNTPEPPKKKSVTFARELDIQEAPIPVDNIEPSQQAIQTAKASATRINDLMQSATLLNIPISDPTIPADESPADAALRKEMLAYGMSDVSAIVAELEIEDFDHDDENFSDSAYDDFDEDTEGSEDEDRYGRSTRPAVNEALRREMRELEEKLGVRMMQNAGPNSLGSDETVLKEGLRLPVTVSGDIAEEDLAYALLAEQKRIHGTIIPSTVSGAETLPTAPRKNIAQVRHQESTEAPAPGHSQAPGRAPVADIVERISTAPAEQKITDTTTTPQKQSRFKSARTTAGPVPVPFIPPKPAFVAPTRTREVPSGPAGKTLADTIIEKDTIPPILPMGLSNPTSTSTSISLTVDQPTQSDPILPDPYDPALLQQEVAVEYYKHRNRQIAREGGFRDFDEERVEETGRVEFTEEEGGMPRVSRFMAARLRGTGG